MAKESTLPAFPRSKEAQGGRRQGSLKEEIKGRSAHKRKEVPRHTVSEPRCQMWRDHPRSIRSSSVIFSHFAFRGALSWVQNCPNCSWFMICSLLWVMKSQTGSGSPRRSKRLNTTHIVAECRHAGAEAVDTVKSVASNFGDGMYSQLPSRTCNSP
jgi:hypothetical protein